MENFTLYIDSDKNCFHLILAAMLKRSGIDPDYVWNQAGLYFEQKDEGIEFTPYYHEIASMTGARLQTDLFLTFEEMLTKLDAVLEEGRSVALMVDFFELPYCMYYKVHHDYHGIEVLRREGDDFLICDHFYQFYGTISLEVLKQALDSNKEQKFVDGYQIDYIVFSESGVPEMQMEDAIRIIELNCKIMAGEIPEGMKLLGDGVYGLASIDRMMEWVDSVLSWEESLAQDQLDKLSGAFKEIGSSRIQYNLFLRKFGLDQLADPIEEAGQCWRVIGNMLLRAKVVGGHEEMKPRVFQRLERVRELETANLELLAAFL